MGGNWERDDARGLRNRAPAAAPGEDRSWERRPSPTSRATGMSPTNLTPARRIVGAGLALLALVALLAVLLHAPLAALFAGPQRAPASTGTATATAGPVLPAFSDWRVAYVGQDGHLHIVSLDGKTDFAWMTLPLLDGATGGTPETIQGSASASPSGQALAYANNALGVVHLRPGAESGFVGIKDTAVDLAWSADGSLLAYGDRSDHVVVMHYPSLEETNYLLADPQAATSAHVQPLGFRDASHVIVVMTVSAGIQFDALDLTSAQAQPITTLPATGLGTLGYWLSPDGHTILVSNSAQGQDHARVTPYIEVIDTSTGQARTLHSAVTLAGNGIAAAAWQPGSSLVAVAGGDPARGGPQIRLLDTQRDTLRSLGATGFPQAWVPGANQLIVSASGSAQLGSAPHAIVALTIPTTGTPTAITLTSSAATFPLLGLVRTA